MPSFEQYTLARFIGRGFFEKHINRMRRFYKKERNRTISCLKTCAYAEKLTIYEQDAGLHFILKLQTELSDADLGRIFQGTGIRCLTDYYHEKTHGDLHCLVISYGSFREDTMEKVLKALQFVFSDCENPG